MIQLVSLGDPHSTGANARTVVEGDVGLDGRLQLNVVDSAEFWSNHPFLVRDEERKKSLITIRVSQSTGNIVNAPIHPF